MPLKVLTLNLWNTSGPYDARKGRIREWVERLGPDLIGFQEAMRGGGLDQVPELLEGLGYEIEFAQGLHLGRGRVRQRRRDQMADHGS